jgi:rubrerythrin
MQPDRRGGHHGAPVPPRSLQRRRGRPVVQTTAQVQSETKTPAPAAPITPFSWLPPTSWACPGCGVTILTREAGPRCPRCGFFEG